MSKQEKKLATALAAIVGTLFLGYAVKVYVVPKIRHYQFKQKNPDLPGTEK